MIDAIAIPLQTLRDIEGVLGSFLVGERGELIGRDVPAACSSEVLFMLGTRLQQLCDAFVSANIGGAFECTTLYFPQHKVHVRALGNAFLIVVLSAEVNLPALKMAVNMVGRQLLAALSAQSAQARHSAVHPRPPADAAARSYRGRPVSR